MDAVMFGYSNLTMDGPSMDPQTLMTLNLMHLYLLQWKEIYGNVTLAFDGDTLKSYLNGIYESSFLYPNRQLHNYQ